MAPYGDKSCQGPNRRFYALNSVWLPSNEPAVDTSFWCPRDQSKKDGNKETGEISTGMVNMRSFRKIDQIV
jgi:hypothetical protein